MSAGEAASPSVGDSAAARARFLRWEIVEPWADQPHILSALGPVRVNFVVQVGERVRSGHHGIALFNADQQLMWAWATDDLQLEPGFHIFSYSFPMLPLRPGTYSWQLSLWDDGNLVELWDCIPEMIIATQVHQHARDEWNGVLNIPCHFIIHEGEGIQFARNARF